MMNIKNINRVLIIILLLILLVAGCWPKGATAETFIELGISHNIQELHDAQNMQRTIADVVIGYEFEEKAFCFGCEPTIFYQHSSDPYEYQKEWGALRDSVGVKLRWEFK